MSFSTERLRQAIDECVAAMDGGASPSGLCIALSGGLDSTVLAAALAELRGSLELVALRAVHVDHGLHPDSARWSRACTELATRLGLAVESVRVDARPAPGESPEAAARVARYAALAERLRDGEVLCTAHHADDQLETVLLQWLRGGGLRSVAGMPPVQRFGRGWHARPLLGFGRDELETWARATGLAWLEDPSNRDLRYDRNYLRLEVLPSLRRRWPAAARTVARVAAQARDALELETAVAKADLDDVAEGATLRLEGLLGLPAARQRAVLRRWLQELDLPLPSARTLAALRGDVSRAATDRVPRVAWPGAVVHRYRGRLYAEAPEAAPPRTGAWNVAASPVFSLGGQASIERVPAIGEGLSQARTPSTLQVTLRTEGDDFHAAGSRHRRALRKWLQEHGVLPWRRASIPLLRADGELLAIGDLACANRCAAVPGEPAWRIVWHGRPPVTEDDALRLRWREHPPID